jgi:hypothetical protein
MSTKTSPGTWSPELGALVVDDGSKSNGGRAWSAGALSEFVSATTKGTREVKEMLTGSTEPQPPATQDENANVTMRRAELDALIAEREEKGRSTSSLPPNS